MGFFNQTEVVDILGDKAKAKKEFSFIKLFLLGILGGAFIGLGFLACIRGSGTVPAGWGSYGTLIGACLFPIGLIGIVLVGGELATGNMMTMMIGALQKKISFMDLIYNWVVVMLGNMAGGILVAYLWGHVAGMTEGDFLEKTLSIANARAGDAPLAAFISAVGCNIFVCMAVWLSTSARDFVGKLLGAWFPIMIFAVVGFQHVVANAFVIPAAIFSGESDVTLGAFFINMVVVFLGNAVGGALVFGLPCYLMYGRKARTDAKEAASKITKTA
ncbi:formate/nitrite transporter family protein [Muricomes intestini]|uniref:formate/nitrite transporter family protein n=1 Tax=Muricomes intestini TaxID=1796634 RepID=UPI002FE04FA2